MGLAECHSKACCLSNNYCRCAYKLTPVTMSVCSWDLKWNLLLHTKLFKQIHGQKKAGRGAQKMRLCVRVCSSHSEKPKKKKKKNRVVRLGKKCIKRWRGWKDTTWHSAGDLGHQESSATPAGEQGSGSPVAGSQHVAGPAGSKHLGVSLRTGQREPGTARRAGGRGGSQAGDLAAAWGQLAERAHDTEPREGLFAFPPLP